MIGDSAVWRRARWGDNDKSFGPFTFAWSDKYRPLAVILKSWGDGDDDSGPSTLRISLIWFTIIVVLPPIIRPERKKIYPNWDAATVARLGRDWYWDVEVREYGFSYSDGFVIVHYGINPGDSTRDQTWCWHLPWTQWRQISHKIYDPAYRIWHQIARMGWEDSYALRQSMPKTSFMIADHDGENIRCETYVEERIWRLGRGVFKFLGYLAPRKIRRSLVLDFSSEVGSEKGSWKGGMTGHSTDIGGDETPESAMRRYCERDHRGKGRTYRIKYVGPA